ncbi:DUF4145 domain-containing protein [Cronbergia sp. UHCC 0137]|uniref:DUF4145 domain-containing protein n=1 Tax=Cronbergia sp. UHCC 0137 TaxID=3110239 RepID=UPI002B20071C|nr:DUF4145 domain-containing protein [Cronbergia sp. UHCC 0137]MEA5620980.1 DUF4145 domain-containing protein [Cronbergia sp. UHCC 0137]
MSNNEERCPHCNEKTLIKITEGKSPTINHSESDVWEKYCWKILFCNDCKKATVIQESYSSEYREEVYDEETKEFSYIPEVSTELLYPQIKQFGMGYKQFKSPDTYQEAIQLFKSKLYEESINKCRKALEALCLDFNIQDYPNYTLTKKIKSMKENKYFDDTLYQWADIIKFFGDKATHNYYELSERIAQNIIDLTGSLIEYSLERKLRKSKENKQFEYLTQEKKKIEIDEKKG